MSNMEILTGCFEATINCNLKKVKTALLRVQHSKSLLKNRGGYYEEHERLEKVFKEVICVYENSLNALKETYGETIIHGVNCQKVIHTSSGYLHADDDDKKYNVDGCDYCGRCHIAL